MKKLFCKNSTLLLLAIALLSSCLKEKEPIVHTLNLCKSTTKTFGYKPGSYWIYADSVTGKRDSVFPFHYVRDHESNKKDKCMGVGYGALIMAFTQKEERVSEEFLSYWLTFKGIDVQIKAKAIAYRISEESPYTSTDNVDANNITLFMTKNQCEIEDGFLQKFDEIRVRNIYYNDVYSSKYIIGKNSYGKDSTAYPFKRYYLKEGIGMIKYELNDGSVYELVNYHLVQ